MDIKKIIIINLAFLIVIGKMLLLIFSKMSNNLKYFQKDELLDQIYTAYENVYYQYLLNNNSDIESSNNYDNFYSEYNNNINKIVNIINYHKILDVIFLFYIEK